MFENLSLKEINLVNTFCFIVCLYINFLAATGKLNNLKVSDVSHKYDHKLVPAGLEKLQNYYLYFFFL